MTEEEFKHEYMGMCVSDQEIIEYLEKENKQLKSDLNVVRKDRENLQIAVGKGLQEYIKDCPYSALEYYATSKVVEENAELKAKLNGALDVCNVPEFRINDFEKENAELKEKSIIPYQEKGYVFDEDLHEVYFPANGELMVKASVVEELKAQIEKMKPYCKCLCKNYSKFSAMGNDCVNGVCRNCNKWESAE